MTDSKQGFEEETEFDKWVLKYAESVEPLTPWSISDLESAFQAGKAEGREHQREVDAGIAESYFISPSHSITFKRLPSFIAKAIREGK